MDTDPNGKWKSVNGDETYALEWDINKRSLVWEIGGFEGRWASQIAEKYDPYITIFEPTKFGYGRCSERLFVNKKVKVNPHGLWVTDCDLPLYNPGNDGGSVLMPHVTSEVCHFLDVYTEIKDTDVDLCLMNVEGAEYILLPYMIANRLMENIRYFWCQFHSFMPDSEERYLRIHEGMKRTHNLKWTFFPTAVAWERKE